MLQPYVTHAATLCDPGDPNPTPNPHQVTLGAKEMKAPTIIPVSDGSPFRRQLGDKLGAATPKGGATPKRQLGDDAKLCNEIPRATCGAPHEICFHDTLCPGGGPGCGAGGDASCRFCGKAQA